MNFNIKIKTLLTLIGLSGSQLLHAQQVSNPTLNIPTPPPAQNYPTVTYYGLENLTGQTKFNYIRTHIPEEPYQNWPSGDFRFKQVTDYYDGLGRPLQTVNRRAHAERYDIVKPYVYDVTGKEVFQYPPFAVQVPPIASTSGKIKTDVMDKMAAFYNGIGPDEQPYTWTKYDGSPLNRITKSMPPGLSWSGADRGKSFAYKNNVAGEVMLWHIGPESNALPTVVGTYAADELYVSVVTDEDGHYTKEFKDKSGNVILKKVFESSVNEYGHTGFACTYYVYDDMKRLRYVIPPQAVYSMPAGWDVSVVKEYCYSYFYDSRGLMVEKKVPGKGVEEFIYDKRDRLVMSRDSELRQQNKCQFTFYDALDRPVVTGFAEVSIGRLDVVNYVMDNVSYPPSDFLYYIKNYDLYHVYPPSNLAGCDMLTYTYYDDYNELSGINYDYSQFSGNLPGASQAYLTAPPQTPSIMTKGLVTGTKIAVLDPTSGANIKWLTTANFYDDNGRLIQAVSNNLKDGKEVSSNIYYFQGMLWRNILHHENPEAEPVPGATDGPITAFDLVKTFERNIGIGGGLDQVGKITQKINLGPVYTLAEYDYDHLGRVTVKDLNAGLVLNEYNMRGFLRHIDAEDHSVLPYKPFFEEHLYYDTGFASRLYNGNIAGIIWSGSDAEKRAYGYSYDQLDRLTHAEFRLNDGTWNHTTKDYTVSNISYDLNGNLRTMDQKGWDPVDNTVKAIDKLTYTYKDFTNKLVQVEDAGVSSSLPDFKNGSSDVIEYDYDLNGNMVADANKNIGAIKYNHLNKPVEINVTGQGKIHYFYDALGTLLRKKISGDSTATYDYFGGFVYKDNYLQYIVNEEGRARPIANDTTLHATRFVYDYFIKDHLGNVRSTVTAEPITSAYLARHEIATANIEQLVFDNIPSVRDGKPISSDPEDNKAAHLVAENPEQRIGTAIMLRVMPGDKFTINASSFYDGDFKDKGTVEGNQVVESLLGALMGGSTYAGVPVSELPENLALVQRTLTNPELAGQLEALQIQNQDPDAPKAHIKYLFFNDKMELVPELSGGIQIPTQVSPGGWQIVDPGDVCNCSIAGPGTTGFVIIYIDNQSIGKDVWFDNIHIEHYTSKVLEESHYYPHGLTVGLNQPGQGNLPGQPYKYNGKELEKVFGLEMYDYGARMFDPQLGVWHSPDPLADNYYGISPFAYTANNPVKYIDPDGRKVEFATKKSNSSENENITMSLTGKLSNESSNNYTPEQMQSFADRAASAIAITFSGKDGDVSWTSTVDLGVASEKNPVNSTDHVFHIVDPKDVPQGVESDALGSTLGGSKDIYLSTALLDDDRKPAAEGPFKGTGKTVMGTGTLEYTSSHEVGHGNTLDHPVLGTLDGNIMHQSKWQNGGMKTTKSQIFEMRKAYKEGRLNLDYEKPVKK